MTLRVKSSWPSPGGRAALQAIAAPAARF